MKWGTFIEWGEYRPGEYQWYISWVPNWLEKENRYVGVQRHYYDGPHVSFGFWFFNISWSTWHSLPPFDFMSEEYKAKWNRRNRYWRAIMGIKEYKGD